MVRRTLNGHRNPGWNRIVGLELRIVGDELFRIVGRIRVLYWFHPLHVLIKIACSRENGGGYCLVRRGVEGLKWIWHQVVASGLGQ